jgi:hypothetical protein
MKEWINIPDDITNYIGFVYIIEIIDKPDDYPENFPTKYIGKKLFFRNVKLPPLKGKKRNRKVLKESDFRKYFGSSNELKKIVEKYGTCIFKRTILHCCESKWSLAYMETLEQMRHGVLFDDSFFNGIVHLRINKCPVIYREKYRKISEEFFKKLS